MLLLAPHGIDMRIKPVGETHPALYTEVLKIIDPDAGSIAEAVLRETRPEAGAE
jgi:hypothetical protein